jgi:hypothetical protein
VSERASDIDEKLGVTTALRCGIITSSADRRSPESSSSTRIEVAPLRSTTTSCRTGSRAGRRRRSRFYFPCQGAVARCGVVPTRATAVHEPVP